MAVRKRRHLSLSVKLASTLNALGLTGKKINWDHRPPLSHRPYDETKGDYDPPELDPRYIFPVLAEENKALADGNHRPMSGDTSVAAKLKRIAANHEEFRRRLLAKDEGLPPPEPLKKRRSRPIPSRPFERKKK